VEKACSLTRRYSLTRDSVVATLSAPSPLTPRKGAVCTAPQYRV
jgi:hypothetical protein